MISRTLSIAIAWLGLCVGGAFVIMGWGAEPSLESPLALGCIMVLFALALLGVCFLT